MKLKPSKSMPMITKYSHGPERSPQNLHLMNITEKDSDEENSIDKAPFEELDVDESSDDNFYYYFETYH
ncbi:unnamed protein product [Rotaria sp. Silwood2]|nr:unnamed protein product [Rotaria sp. Silwood2]